MIMKNHLYKAALLAALGLALSPVAKAADLYVGFNDYAKYGVSGTDTGDDYVIDLGAYTDFTTTSTFSTSISSALFTEAFGGDANALNDVAVGAVAAGTISGNDTYTYATGSPTLPSSAAKYNEGHNAATSIPTGVYAASGSSSSPTWDYLVAQGPTETDQSGTGVSSQFGSVEDSLVNGDVTLTLYESLQTSPLSKGSAFTELGTLTIDANSTGAGADTITYNGVNASVPEPTTYGLCAGAGLLMLALRRQFVAKNA
jgi:hypothetical protein